jgi:hypothetical protein
MRGTPRPRPVCPQLVSAGRRNPAVRLLVLVLVYSVRLHSLFVSLLRAPLPAGFRAGGASFWGRRRSEAEGRRPAPAGPALPAARAAR